MDPNPKASTDKDEGTSTIDVASKYSKESCTLKENIPEDVSVTACVCETQLVRSDTSEAEDRVEQEMWSSQDDENIDRELNSKEYDIHNFIADFKDFHALMIQLNESQYYGRRMDTTYAAIETDLQDLMGELAYRRAQEVQEQRQKAELEELLESIKDDEDSEDSEEVDVGQYEDDMTENQRVANEVLDDLLKRVTDSSSKNNDENANS